MITWSIRFNQPFSINRDEQYESIPYTELAKSKYMIPVDINHLVLQVFTDASFVNDLIRRRYTTRIVSTYFCGTIIYQSKT